MIKNGPFVTVEGVDGAGKSSHIDAIVESLENEGWTVIRTREPGGTPRAEELREIILNKEMPITEEIKLIFEAREDVVNNVILPALEKGYAVVCDRFTDSTYAYQGGSFPESKPLIKAYEDKVIKDLKPDLTLLFDLPIEVSLQRLDLTGKVPDKFESKGKEYFENVRASYLERVNEDSSRFAVMDSTQTKDKVSEDVKEVMKDFAENYPKPRKKFKYGS